MANLTNSDFKIKFLKNEQIKFDKKSIDELNNFLELDKTIELIKNNDKDYFNENAKISEVVITPDFHKGSGIPIGTVILTEGFIIPQAVGNDVNCGMRAYVTDLSEDEIKDNFKELEKKIRYIFFEGGRDIPLNKKIRHSILTNGLTGLLENYKDLKDKGIWKYYNENQQREDILSVNDNGSITTDKTNNFEDFLGTDQFTYDNQSGSIGGGNHFVELQKVSEVLDSQTAYAWGLKKDSIVIMVHTGSVSLGHLTGSYAKEMLKEIYPKSLKHPDNGIYPLPESEKYKSQWDLYHSSLANSANFAFVNRLLLGLMLQRAITETIRECDFKLIYDASHNIVKKYDDYSYIHRKGACPARGCDAMTNPKFSYYGEPVFIPGSMGSKSYIMAGTGNKESLCSASHGAGRKLSRGQALKEDNSKFEEFIKNFKIITPIDSNSDLIKKRSDILKKWQEDIKKEAPYAYKDISPIIDVHVENNMAKPVVELIPIFTIKG